MSEKVFPASKPTPAPASALPVTNGSVPPKAPMKLRPPPPRRAQPYNNSRASRNRRSKRSVCCCFLFWIVLLALVLLLIAVIAGASLYVLYHPHRPNFTIRSLYLHRFNLTSTPDGSHLSTLYNLTITSRNSNSHIAFIYEGFSISAVSSSGVLLGNGSIPAFTSRSKNVTTFRNVIVSGSADLDADTAAQLNGDLKRRTDGTKVVPTKLLLDTKVVAKAGKVRNKRVGIRVTCDGIGALARSGKPGPNSAAVSGIMCKADLRIKIWKFTF